MPLAPFREALPGQPAIVALPVPQPYGDYGKIVDFGRSTSRCPTPWPRSSTGWCGPAGGTCPSPSGPGGIAPVESRHVCLLFRRMRSWGDDVTRPYVRALEARNLRHVLVGGSSFHVREEVEALRNVLLAIERPEDELALFATLRGPFFAFDDGTLLAWRDAVSVAAPVPEVSRATRRPSWRRWPRRWPSCATCIVSAIGARSPTRSPASWPPCARTPASPSGPPASRRSPTSAGCSIWRGARSGRASPRSAPSSSSSRPTPSVREEGEAPIVEDGTDGVRIMTVHRAKGLEFPVVILADPTAGLARDEPDRHVDAERRRVRAPARRLVAARAAGAPRRRGGARSRGGRARALRRGDAGARPARGSGAGRRPYRRLARAAGSGGVPGRSRACPSRSQPAGCPSLRGRRRVRACPTMPGAGRCPCGRACIVRGRVGTRRVVGAAALGLRGRRGRRPASSRSC